MIKVVMLSTGVTLLGDVDDYSEKGFVEIGHAIEVELGAPLSSTGEFSGMSSVIPYLWMPFAKSTKIKIPAQHVIFVDDANDYYEYYYNSVFPSLVSGELAKQDYVMTLMENIKATAEDSEEDIYDSSPEAINPESPILH